jgi:hypothetical protein
MEVVETQRTADFTTEWIGSELKRWRVDEEEHRSKWDKKSPCEKRTIDEEWKKMIGPEPGGAKVHTSEVKIVKSGRSLQLAKDKRLSGCSKSVRAQAKLVTLMILCRTSMSPSRPRISRRQKAHISSNTIYALIPLTQSERRRPMSVKSTQDYLISSSAAPLILSKSCL